MALRKFSKSDSLFELLTTQSQHLIEAADLLGQIIAADPQDRTDLNTKLHEVEHRADDACHTVLKKVNQSFVLPFDREDLYDLTSVTDTCVDLMDEAGDDLILFKPSALPDGVNLQVAILRECAQLTHEAMGKLASIDKTTRDYWVQVNQLENEGDQVYRAMMADLFEGGTDALEVMKVKLVLDAMENAIDSFEELSAVVETIAIKES
ncbi:MULTISPECIES: DUF47 family protein [unclassified Actinobaculum]|uniref:DUF47 domain-containing protein n=1 Tax=unclassified Actinobaculum TaxID=2609299 RepID=UPI000D528734|nr:MULTISPECIES: DUF47 family protein [unclassified Actinobaculum]AWE43037.1 DUF47 domain-containing protein [Actinobaculum sp. 313]RTE48576.1 DUF47 family protein [Actinobaculum sp. 352]